MTLSLNKLKKSSHRRLKWLMSLRLLFAVILLISTIIFWRGENLSYTEKPFLIIYALIIFILILTICYAIIFSRINRKILFTYIQVSIDTFIVTLIIYITGSFSSIFSFLYLLVIVYTSMLIFRRGSIFIATICSIEYSVMVFLEYYDFIKPLILQDLLITSYEWYYVVYRVIIMIAACFAVAILSSLLAEQERRATRELLAMEDHVKRVEKMAAIGEMAAGLAHEIKNPIASISGSVQLLSEEIECEDDLGRLMKIVLREADRLSSLVSDFLLFARPTPGNPEVLQVDKTVSEIVTLFKQDNVRVDKIKIETELSTSWVEIDSGHFHQVLWNLLLNAADSMDEKGTINVKVYPGKDGNINIKVSDTGCGMSSEITKSIFDPFFTTKKNGTGLGLSIAYRILESYNARLDVRSVEGKGTTFIIKFQQHSKSNIT